MICIRYYYVVTISLFNTYGKVLLPRERNGNGKERWNCNIGKNWTHVQMVIQIGRYFIDKFFGQDFFKRRKKYFAMSLILLERDEDNKRGNLTIYIVYIGGR